MLSVFLASYTVAMVTYYITKMIITFFTNPWSLNSFDKDIKW